MVLPNDDVRTHPLFGEWQRRDEEVFSVLTETRKELDRQDRLADKQTYPSAMAAPGVVGDYDRTRYAISEGWWAAVNGRREARGNLSWDGVVLEQAYEALSQKDPARQEEALIRLAAVALNAVTASRRARTDPNEVRAAFLAKLSAEWTQRWIAGFNVTDDEVRKWHEMSRKDGYRSQASQEDA